MVTDLVLCFFLVLVWQELAVYFGFLLKGAWVVCLMGKQVSTFGSVALALDCGPWSGSLASEWRGMSRLMSGHLGRRQVY